MKKKRCEGMRRYGGSFTFGPVKWVPCKKAAITLLTIKQDGKESDVPACVVCWNEAAETKGIEIIKTVPIKN